MASSMEATLLKNTSRICCVCLKHIADEPRITYLRSGMLRQKSVTFSKLVALMPELKAKDILFSNSSFCNNCTADVDSTFNFKEQYTRNGMTTLINVETQPIFNGDNLEDYIIASLAVITSFYLGIL